MPNPFKIAVIGTGNVAFHLSSRLKAAGNPPVAVVSRTPQKANEMIRKVGLAKHTKTDLSTPADFIVFAIPDQYIVPVLDKYAFPGNPVLIHCSGGTHLNVFKRYAQQYGVLYPLQTFSRDRKIDFEKIPILFEGSHARVEQAIGQLASLLGPDIRKVTSAQRLKIHLAAVFVCNFSNHLFGIAEDLLSETELTFRDLKHLIAETADKAYDLSPRHAQTGPAMRNDIPTMEKHLEILNNADLRELYRLHSRLISKKSIK